MTHMIRQQYLHVELNGTETEGMALERSLPDLCHHWLTPAIEQTLEHCAPSDGHLTIERLELDVGTLMLQNLEQTLPESVTLALENAIREQMLVKTTPTTQEEDLVQHKTAQQSLDEAFIHFLKTGSLPWSFRLPEGTHLEQTLLNSWQEVTEPSHTVGDAISQALASATVRQRLIQQFSPVFLEALLLTLSPEAKSVIGEIVAILRSASVSSDEITPFEQQFWQSVFADVAANHAVSAKHLVSESWHNLAKTNVESTALVSVLEHRWPGVTGMMSTKTDRIEHMETTASAHSKLRPSISPESDTTLVNNLSKAGEPRSNTEIRETEERQGVSKGAETGIIREHPEARAGIYIKNAGLVLLHPFLPQFFSALNIADGNMLLQPERALCLLHFLATGQPTTAEYNLILPKVLCNIPLLTPVETNLELTDTEMTEAVALLEAVIGHWNVLRNTSPDGLRGTFLLRPGKVSLRDDDDWLLQVESNSVDILLNQLPWGISMIKLPWMDKMLWVEWR